MGISFIVKQTPDPEPVLGGWLSVDSTPLSSSLAFTKPALIDGITNVNAGVTFWGAQESIGIDMGSSITLSGLKLYNVQTNPILQTGWLGAGNDSVGLYISNDNSTWTFIEQFDAPPFTAALLQFDFTVTFSSNQTARYFKVRNMDSNLATSPSGLVLYPAEIEVILP